MSEKQAPPPYGMTAPSAPTGMYPTLSSDSPPGAYPQYPQPQPGYPQPQPGYPQPQPAMGPRRAVMSVPVGPHSSRLTCPSCNASISTRVEKEATTKTHIIALLLCVFMCWPCVCLPYCMDSCKNSNHYCPSCNAFIGSYSN